MNPRLESNLEVLIATHGGAMPGRGEFVNLMKLGDRSTGDRLRALRKLAGLSQDEMAQLSNGELSQKAVSHMECNPEGTPLRHFLAAGRILNKTLNEILEEEVSAV